MLKIRTIYDREEPVYKYLDEIIAVAGLNLDQGETLDSKTAESLWSILSPLNQIQREAILEEARGRFKKGHGRMIEEKFGENVISELIATKSRSAIGHAIGQASQSMRFLDNYLKIEGNKPVFDAENAEVIAEATSPIYRPNTGKLFNTPGISDILGLNQDEYDELIISAPNGIPTKQLKKLLQGKSVGGALVDEKMILKYLRDSSRRFERGTVGNTSIDIASHHLTTMGMNAFAIEAQNTISQIHQEFTDKYTAIHKKSPDNQTRMLMEAYIDAMITGEINEDFFRGELSELFDLSSDKGVAGTFLHRSTKKFQGTEKRKEWETRIQEYVLRVKIFLFKMRKINLENVNVMQGRSKILTALINPGLLIRNKSIIPIPGMRTPTDKMAAEISDWGRNHKKEAMEQNISGKKNVLR